jgi:hypothetical protein
MKRFFELVPVEEMRAEGDPILHVVDDYVVRCVERCAVIVPSASAA